MVSPMRETAALPGVLRAKITAIPKTALISERPGRANIEPRYPEESNDRFTESFECRSARLSSAGQRTVRRLPRTETELEPWPRQTIARAARPVERSPERARIRRFSRRRWYRLPQLRRPA